MKYNLKLTWAITLITLLSAGCKKESETLLEEKSTTINLISGGAESKAKQALSKEFLWESPQATEARQKLKDQKQSYAISLTGLTYRGYREPKFENSSTSFNSKFVIRDAFNRCAIYFGINTPWSIQAEEKFIKALKEHMQNPANSLIGHADNKGKPSFMINIYNPRTGLNVELNTLVYDTHKFPKIAKISPNQANELAASGIWPSLHHKNRASIQR